MKINQNIGLAICLFWVFGPVAWAQNTGNEAKPEPANSQTQVMTAETLDSDASSEVSELQSVSTESIMSDNITEEPYNPLAPAKAAFYSAVLPGLGQAYNKKYWKIPVVYGGIAAGVYFYQRNTKDYNRFRDAYKRRLAGYQDDEFQGVSDARLRDAQKTAGRNRDVSLAMAIGVYLLNILDANVDAHLLRYNLNEDLSLRPEFQYQSDFRPSVYGLSLNISLP